ncbi:MAG: hypothetical protein ACE5FT_00695 [Candidatus Nanoarchaeia archaeon]
MAKEKYVMICPKCKSTDISMDYSNPIQPAIGLPARYVCGKCNHNAYTFPEVSLSKVKKFKGNPKIKASVVDTSYGKFEVRALWKVGGPLFILIGLFFYLLVPIVGVLIILAGWGMCYITYFRKRKLKE